MSFVVSHWLEIVLSALTTVVGAVVSYVFYWLQSRRDASLAQERARQTRGEIIDILENDIVNKREITQQRILNLVAAAERDRDVDFSVLPSSHLGMIPLTLLQDVELRLQRSKHLDPSEKENYIDRIEGLIADIRQSSQAVPVGKYGIVDLVTMVKEALQENRKDEAIQRLELLEQELERFDTLMIVDAEARIHRWRISASVIAGLVAIIAMSVVLLDALSLAAGVYAQFVLGFLAAGILGYLLQQIRLARRVAVMPTDEIASRSKGEL